MKGFAWLVALLATLSLVVVGVGSVVWWYDFSKNCGDYLKLAGDAPTVERADEFLGQAVSYIKKQNLTSGNSAYIFKTPKNDVGIWYNQLKGAKETTETLLAKLAKDPTSVSQLERDNALMKIREVVLDDTQSGVSVTTPDHITWFPDQWLILIWWIVSIIFAAIGWTAVLATWNSY